ncbi:gamma-crystallin B-like [Periophthalmus magnuspinnatus]|uniref:gamma-crystallin B-like n=1 Tax=Periophthalmus magnuspinnatus TaxID=409849 RepID=UPI002436C018|nr:gamma-crystallin B-like [Periophthalmus magnuspinnatus]
MSCEEDEMGKIIFFEEKAFCGRHYECSGDCPDLMSFLTQCGSIRVTSGCFMIYERPNYTGHQYCLRSGEYADVHSMGPAGTVSSCRFIPVEQGCFNMRLYERIEFGGQIMNLEDDCPSVLDRFHIKDIFSCNVTDGNWLFYEDTNYCGRMYLIQPGEYKRFSEWGSRSARVGSIQRITND